MKTIIIAFVSLLCASQNVSAQCGDELMKTALTAMGNYQYIKDFDIKLPATQSKEGSKYSIVLNSRTHYQVNIANGATNSENMVVELYDGDKLIGANAAQGKIYPAFQFICSKTGAYRLKIYCQNGTEACARAVLSLVKQYTEAEMP